MLFSDGQLRGGMARCFLYQLERWRFHQENGGVHHGLPSGYVKIAIENGDFP